MHDMPNILQKTKKKYKYIVLKISQKVVILYNVIVACCILIKITVQFFKNIMEKGEKKQISQFVEKYEKGNVVLK